MDDTSGRVGRDPSDPAGDRKEIAGRTTERTRGYATGEREDSVDERTREIRQEIEDTRGEMTETIDAIQEKLKPRNIVANATDRVKSVASERVREMTDAASETAQQAMDYTRDRTSEAVGKARQNPIPLALIGVGAAWLLTTRSRRTASYGQQEWYDNDNSDRGFMARVRNNPIPAALAGVGLGWLAFAGNEAEDDYLRYDRSHTSRMPAIGPAGGGAGSDVAARTKEMASDAAGSVKRMARRRQNQLQRMVEENPLLVGAGALMLGAAFGTVVPETETENEWMGDARDNVVDRAREMARDAASQVQDAAGTVADAAQKVAGKTQT
jgi:hypothetical protein